MKHRVVLTVIITILSASSIAAQSWIISSPGDKVKAVVQLADLGGQADYPTGQVRLYYSVSAGGPSNYSEVVQPSPMGLTRLDKSFLNDLTFVSEGALRTIDSSYTMVMGKRSLCRNYCNEKILTFQASSGSSLLQVYLRAYDDGFAFRYAFPDTAATAMTVMSEATGFRPETGSTMWMQPYNIYSAADIYSPAYEDCWQRNLSAGSKMTTSCKPSDSTWCFPAMYRTPAGCWALLWETDVTPSYCCSHLSAATQSVYRIAFPNVSEGGGASVSGAATPSSTLPWMLPWRVVIAGTSPGVILESTLSTDLATPSVIGDVSWIKPGRSSWSWWSSNGSPAYYDSVTPFIDLAAQMGWEYTVLDGGWCPMKTGTWKTVESYAASKNVGLILWYNAGGPINTVGGYTPRDSLYDSAKRLNQFQTISSAGIKGVKIDFWLSDKQQIVKYYWDVFRDAAKNHLLVNPHGGTPPRGWQRTFPNCITAEAVRGAEMYIWDADDPIRFTWQHTILPFTRNAVASMDWTPVTFTNNTEPHKTSFGHELALSILFESGIQHFADRVSGYQTSTISVDAQTFLKQVPVVWDDTKYLQGYPGSYVVLARRKGFDWYVAGIAGDTAHLTNVNLTFLQSAPASYGMTLIADGVSATTFSKTVKTVGSTDTVKVAMPAFGGWVAKLVNLNPDGVQRKMVIPAVAGSKAQTFMVTGEQFAAPGGATGKKVWVSVYSLNGELLKTKMFDKKTINLKKDLALPSCIYIVKTLLR